MYDLHEPIGRAQLILWYEQGSDGPEGAGEQAGEGGGEGWNVRREVRVGTWKV